MSEAPSPQIAGWQMDRIRLDCQVCGRTRAVSYQLEFKHGKCYMKPIEHCTPGRQHPAMSYEMTLTKAINEDGKVLLEREVQ